MTCTHRSSWNTQVLPMSNHHGHDERQNGGGFEQQDLGSRPVYGFLISLVVVGVLLSYVLWGVFHFLDAFDRKRERPVNPVVQGAQDTWERITPYSDLKIPPWFP